MPRFLHAAKVPWTFGSPVAWVMNCLRATGRFEAALGRRYIEDVQQETDGHVSIRLKGYAGRLYFPRELTVEGMFPLLIEQLCRWHWHYYQIPQTRIGSDDVVFDCGSAEGLFAFLNQRQARRIYAFEPLPLFVNSLHRTFQNGSNVEVVGAGLAEKPGTARVHEAGVSSYLTSESAGPAVNIESIDHFCEQHGVRMSYLKADVEGHELKLLAGASRSIKINKPKIAITTYHLPEHAVEIVGFLRALNPEYKFLLKGICRPHGNPIMLHAW